MNFDTTFINPGESSQRQRHMTKRFTDQHGRVFSATVDQINGQPVSELICVTRALPWQPPQRYAVFGPPGDHSLIWDYRAMTDDLLAETRDYYSMTVQAASKHKIPAPKVGDEVAMEIRAELGTPPLSPEVPLSAEAEDPWLLGVPGAERNTVLYNLINQTTIGTELDVREQIKARVEARIGKGAGDALSAQPSGVKQYNDFVAAHKSQGYSLDDIRAMWHKRKEDPALEAR